jgi:hypothetical protein
MVKNGFEAVYTTAVGGKLEDGRFDVEIVSLEIYEKVVLYSDFAKEHGIVNKEFKELSRTQQEIVLQNDRISKNGKQMPKVADKINIHVKEPVSGVTMKWNNGISIELPYWPEKDDKNAFVNQESAPLSKDFYAFVEGALLRRAPARGQSFALGDLIKKGDVLSVEVERDNKNYARVKSKSAMPKGSIFKTAAKVVEEAPALDAGADALLAVMQDRKDYVQGKSSGFIAITALKEWTENGTLAMTEKEALAAWTKIKSRVIDADGNVAL